VRDSQDVFSASALLIIGSLLLLSAASPLVASPRQCPQESKRGGSRTIEFPIDLKTVKELQQAFENGHQPWRGDVTAVAAAAVTEALGTDPGVEPASKLVTKLVVECEAPSESIVAGKDASKEYRVYLKRLLSPQGGKPSIWTAIRVSVTPLN
jgi:hypothetical protein